MFVVLFGDNYVSYHFQSVLLRLMCQCRYFFFYHLDYQLGILNIRADFVSQSDVGRTEICFGEVKAMVDDLVFAVQRAVLELISGRKVL